eukprot:scaffold323473_cov40-Tisochrysis_lutea.AAC.1
MCVLGIGGPGATTSPSSGVSPACRKGIRAATPLRTYDVACKCSAAPHLSHEGCILNITSPVLIDSPADLTICFLIVARRRRHTVERVSILGDLY